MKGYGSPHEKQCMYRNICLLKQLAMVTCDSVAQNAIHVTEDALVAYSAIEF